VVRLFSLRFRILGLVLGVAIVPLVLIGAVLLRGAAQSGERLLSERLEGAADDTREALIRNWIPLRSWLLDASEWPEVQDVAESGSAETLQLKLLELDPRVREVEIRTLQEGTVFKFDRSALTPEEGGLPPPTGPLLRVRFDLFRVADESAAIEFGLEGDLLLPRNAQPASAAGMILTLVDPDTRAALLPVPLDASVLGTDRFTWGGEEWLAARRSFGDPPLELVVAAPLTPYVAPFRRSARNGAFLLAAVALGALFGAIVLTSRITRSLRTLVGGAEAVSAGDLSHRITYREDDEIGRVAEAFNNMTESLQRTLREQASRESLAAVGEFAASLAHEIRNPLTAVKIDLQNLEEKLGDDSSLTEPLRRALEEIDRLDATVGDALSIVRRRDGDRMLNVWRPIEAAAHSAAPAFEGRGASLEVSGGGSELSVLGDASGLEQLFLNLLLNAAEALPRGGRATIGAEREGDLVCVRVEDDGPGIPEHVRDRMFEPLFSTKEAGTGLGLTISQRIVDAHRGELDLREGVDGGTCVEVRLPAVNGAVPKAPDV
jgi:signal transduction histidine kinase